MDQLLNYEEEQQKTDDTITFINDNQFNSQHMLATIASSFCELLGALCILLNMFVIISLIRNRRRVLTNVFYILVLHCAIVDLIRGSCLIVWGLPHLIINSTITIELRLLTLKV